MSNDYDGSIQIEGLDQLLKALEKCDKDVVEEAMKGIVTGAQETINDAKANLRENGSVVTGMLRQSGRVTRKEQDVTAGFFDTTNQSGYAKWVEYGRRAGKMPPPDELGAWAYKKLRIGDWKVANSIGWAMAKRIAKEGTQPHPFFEPAVRKNRNNIIKAVRDAIGRKIR